VPPALLLAPLLRAQQYAKNRPKGASRVPHSAAVYEQRRAAGRRRRHVDERGGAQPRQLEVVK
jgi:hypothetical protein